MKVDEDPLAFGQRKVNSERCQKPNSSPATACPQRCGMRAQSARRSPSHFAPSSANLASPVISKAVPTALSVTDAIVAADFDGKWASASRKIRGGEALLGGDDRRTVIDGERGPLKRLGSS